MSLLRRDSWGLTRYLTLGGHSKEQVSVSLRLVGKTAFKIIYLFVSQVFQQLQQSNFLLSDVWRLKRVITDHHNLISRRQCGLFTVFTERETSRDEVLAVLEVCLCAHLLPACRPAAASTRLAVPLTQTEVKNNCRPRSCVPIGRLWTSWRDVIDWGGDTSPWKPASEELNRKEMRLCVSLVLQG